MKKIKLYFKRDIGSNKAGSFIEVDEVEAARLTGQGALIAGPEHVEKKKEKAPVKLIEPAKEEVVKEVVEAKEEVVESKKENKSKKEK